MVFMVSASEAFRQAAFCCGEDLKVRLEAVIVIIFEKVLLTCLFFMLV